MATGAVGADIPLVLRDDGCGQFGPLCDLRDASALRCGVVTNGERVARSLGLRIAARWVPDALAEVVAESTGVPTGAAPAAEEIVVASARLPSMRDVPVPGRDEAIVTPDGAIVLARLSRAHAESLRATGQLDDQVRREVAEVPLVAAPWDVLDSLASCLVEDAEAILRDADRLGFAPLPDPHPMRMGAHPILMHRTASVAPHVVLDATHGPVVLCERATIRPFSVLIGPCAIGPSSVVADRSLIKANTTCGPACRLGGEIGGTSIAGFSNKTHDGHLGDSVLGEWVNLGAGTDNSNLLNTYGEVSMRLEPDGPRERSGRIFLGSIIGDHVKCAIGTRLMTGTVLGTGAMIARTSPPPSTTRRFAWLTDDGERRFALPKFLEVAKAVMARRGVTPGPAYLARLAALHAESGALAAQDARS